MDRHAQHDFPGVHLGEGCVIAAGSIVAKDVEPYTIVGGNPAKPIKKRFEDFVIQELLALKIYDRSDEELDRIQAALCSDDLNLLKKELNQLK